LIDVVALRSPGSPLRKPLDRTPITLDQRFFLRATPALDLALDRDGVGDPTEMLGQTR
jgi:hypothetical protein